MLLSEYAKIKSECGSRELNPGPHDWEVNVLPLGHALVTRAAADTGLLIINDAKGIHSVCLLQQSKHNISSLAAMTSHPLALVTTWDA